MARRDYSTHAISNHGDVRRNDLGQQAGRVGNNGVSSIKSIPSLTNRKASDSNIQKTSIQKRPRNGRHTVHETVHRQTDQVVLCVSKDTIGRPQR